MKRCSWCGEDPLYVAYHDEEWGIPIHDDRLLFEFLILEGMQAGLSWYTILKKRPAFREAFANFEPHTVAQFSDSDVERLLQNAGIIRNEKKIRAAIENAKAFLRVQKEQGSFDRYIWNFVNDHSLLGGWSRQIEVPCSNPISDIMAKNLKQKGFCFVGTKICYSFMQAVGMVNDHLIDCPRFKDCQKIS